MQTQLELAKKREVTNQMKKAAQEEGLTTEQILDLMIDRKLVIPANPLHENLEAKVIGKNTRVKVNVNLGTSKDCADVEFELKKADMALEYGADTIMDLSIGGDVPQIRRLIRKHTSLPFGTVPAYEAFEMAKRETGSCFSLKATELFQVIRNQAEDGVDFMTLHCGITKHSFKCLKNHKRMMGIVSRGGSLMAQWMQHNNQENPLFEHFDELLGIAAEYDITLSLGDALRPGCVQDGTDRGQIEELVILGELASRAYEKNVQVIIEGPGHLTMNHVAPNIELQKQLCDGAPFYVLGPVVCDVAPGYDHITAAIGSAIAAYHGADFLCYVTPAEHLRLPDWSDVKEGIMAAKIAAFSADLARGRPYAVAHNNQMVRARQELNWKEMFALSLDPQKAEEYYRSVQQDYSQKTCSMCGDMCAIKMGRD